MKALVIGYGSIGRRHAANLASLGHDVVLLRHAAGAPSDGRFREYVDFDRVVDAERPDCAIVASPTPRHAEDAGRLIERRIPFLLEKPPAFDLASALTIERRLHDAGFRRYDLAFNLRFYPPLQLLRERLPDLCGVYSVRVAAGSYLPDWRPGIDYRSTTSARRELGGGVHIELVHELDYVIWLFGMPSGVIATVKRVSGLDISSDDLCAAILDYDAGPVVEIHLDYLSHKNLRGCQVTGARGTIEWSFADRSVTLFRSGQPAQVLSSLPSDYDFNQTYQSELRHFADVAAGDEPPVVDIAQGIRVMRLLDAMVQSSATGARVPLRHEATAARAEIA